ncbi:lysophosphatidic acid acyltransferase / lysophosphatidylinositol acyltransferase [Nematocida homosporus]|uniref:lysophosphatidic acid acyltransferase / lysophosphatidylinositol acyltransferase n=1 Tax=Nematocida homosporus TaxID=1912981 RepID=UPI00221EAB26|nr:lysophosphatidic acid acyltransferase / lysophosphatidylinositol acyltransferase [Nematocida homosporus]KAI5184282.1 lysophosphatidic acid acyltransferase / lysophosphatidylinositol acyltransferase [Nematocida homosporus]
MTFQSLTIRLHKLAVILLLVLIILFLLVVEICLFPVFLFNRTLIERIMGLYAKLITNTILYSLRIGNPHAIRFCDNQGQTQTNLAQYNDQKSSYILVSNHICALDTVLVRYIGFELLQVDTKYISKESMKWVPIVGWAMYMSGFLFIKRSWEKDAQNIKDWCAVRQRQPRQALAIYPEGTRFTPAKHKLSLTYAKQHGLPHLSNLLLPRTKGFQLFTTALANTKFTQILNLTIVYTENNQRTTAPSLLQALLHPLPGTFNIHIQPDQLATINDPNQYLLSTFTKKDALITNLFTK